VFGFDIILCKPLIYGSEAGWEGGTTKWESRGNLARSGCGMIRLAPTPDGELATLQAIMVVSEEVLNKLFQDSPHPSTHRKRYPTTPPPKKKLIEVTLPLAAINKASVREKSIRPGLLPRALWWARRPLATCRAVLFAQLVDEIPPATRTNQGHGCCRWWSATARCPGAPSAASGLGAELKAAAEPIPTHFMGTVMFSSDRPARDMSRIVEAVVEQLTTLPGAEVSLKLEIDAEVAGGLDRAKVRTLMENAATPGFIDKLIE